MGMGYCSGGVSESSRPKIIIPYVEEDRIPDKFCPRCRQYYPLTKEFWYKNKYHNDRDGHGSECKKCANAYGKSYRERRDGS